MGTVSLPGETRGAGRSGASSEAHRGPCAFEGRPCAVLDFVPGGRPRLRLAV